MIYEVVSFWKVSSFMDNISEIFQQTLLIITLLGDLSFGWTELKDWKDKLHEHVHKVNISPNYWQNEDKYNPVGRYKWMAWMNDSWSDYQETHLK